MFIIYDFKIQKLNKLIKSKKTDLLWKLIMVCPQKLLKIGFKGIWASGLVHLR